MNGRTLQRRTLLNSGMLTVNATLENPDDCQSLGYAFVKAFVEQLN
jgi:hypothetical protein